MDRRAYRTGPKADTARSERSDLRLGRHHGADSCRSNRSPAQRKGGSATNSAWSCSVTFGLNRTESVSSCTASAAARSHTSYGSPAQRWAGSPWPATAAAKTPRSAADRTRLAQERNDVFAALQALWPEESAS